MPNTASSPDRHRLIKHDDASLRPMVNLDGLGVHDNELSQEAYQMGEKAERERCAEICLLLILEMDVTKGNLAHTALSLVADRIRNL